MTGRVAGKVVVVTGGANGIGRACAEALEAEGADVRVVDLADGFDVADEGAWTSFAATLDRVDALVNCAGIPARSRLPDVPIDEWHRAMDVNALGPLLGIQALAPLMPSGSSIVNIISVAALGGHAAAAYTASKWALRGLTRSASLELGVRGIRVNGIFPGLIETDLMADAPPAFRERAIADTPLGRTGTVDDIAPLVVYLVSDESSFVNGAEIAVDGGLTAHVSHKGIADGTRP